MGAVPSGVNLGKIPKLFHIYNTNLHVDTQEASKYNKNSDKLNPALRNSTILKKDRTP